jgi:hypothetical protein
MLPSGDFHAAAVPGFLALKCCMLLGVVLMLYWLPADDVQIGAAVGSA